MQSLIMYWDSNYSKRDFKIEDTLAIYVHLPYMAQIHGFHDFHSKVNLFLN